MSKTPEQEEWLALEAITALRAFDPNKKAPCRGQVDTIWRAINEGLMNDEDIIKWARIIAAEVVKNVLDNKEAENRPKRALAALKLHGAGGRHHIEKSALNRILGFERFRTLLRGDQYTCLTPSEAAEILKREGHFQDMKVRHVTNVIGKWPALARQK